MDNLTLPIVPKPEEGRIDHQAEHPVGTGPFRFVSYSTDEELVLEANPTYFEGPPRIRTVRFRIVPDETVRVLELEKGNVSLLLNPISPELLPRLSRKENLRVAKEVGTNYSYLGFNLNDPILRHLSVRKAIAHAIDREGIIRHILKDLAVPAPFLFSPKNGFHNPRLARIGYDPEEAKRLLDEAGFPDPDGEEGPASRFNLVYKTSQNELRLRIAMVIQDQLRQIGVGVDIRSYEWGTFFSDIKNGNFQIYSLTWVGISDPDILHYIFHSKSVPPEGANRGHYQNPEADRLLEQGRREQDPSVRKRIYDEVQGIVAADVPYISLWHSVNVAVFDRRLKGFELFPDENLISLKEALLE
jgi:peptide/nickel transport system substrate-binding protein